MVDLVGFCLAFVLLGFLPLGLLFWGWCALSRYLEGQELRVSFEQAKARVIAQHEAAMDYEARRLESARQEIGRAFDWADQQIDALYKYRL